MSDIINSVAVARDISLLYELSLAVGQSLELETNCAIFLKALASRKNLAYGAVWIKNDYLPEATEPNHATLVFANPEYRIRERQLSLTNLMFALLEKQETFSLSSSDEGFAELIAEKEIVDGTFAVFALREIGALKIFSRMRKKPFDMTELKQLMNVIDKFTVSIQGCLSHRSFLAMQQQIIEAQQMAIRELSTPLLPIADRIVALPVVGNVDSSRAQQMMETLFAGVAQYKAEVAIIDITGVSVIDTQVANTFIQTAQGVRLLGAKVVLTGIGPAVAQVLIHLGVDLSGIVTRSTLQEGIAYALRNNANQHKQQIKMNVM